ncbi:MAG: neutral/alkaline non-lysosomal ceramidase N-terminal domain-containing protein [Haloarculaceae archaeon]
MDTESREMTGDDNPASGLRAGAARRDITPANGDQFFGYARPDKTAEGISLRLFARALVLESDGGRVALVSADLGAPKVRERVLEHVRPLGFDENTLLFACTHTHAGPNDVGDWVAAQVGDAVAAAAERARPAVAGWGTADVDDANRSRSVEAHLANHGQDHQPGTATPELDPEGPGHTRDTTLRLLRVETPDGDPVAAWTHFPVHPTAYTPHNTTYSADCSGVAVRRFAAAFDGAAPLAMHTNGPLGDMIPVYDDHNMHAVADRTGKRIARGMREAWENAAGELTGDVPVAGRATTVTYEGQEVAPGKRVADEAVFGLPFFGGGENGPSLFFDAGLQGLRLPAGEADPVHGRKVVAGADGPWSWPPTVPAQAVRVGDRLLLAYGGEPTVEAARQVCEGAAPAAPDGVEDLAVVGVANGYHGYFTTPEEYDQQHYEGGHTVFGKYTSLAMEQALVDLAADLPAGSAGAAERTGTGPESPPAPVGQSGTEPTITDDAPETVERMETVAVGWEGEPAGRDRPVGDPLLVLEREGGGSWEAVATDLDLGFVWREQEAGTYTARYDVPPALPTGTYRLRVRTAGGAVASSSVEVVPSTGLRVRGVRLTSRDPPTVAVVAQHPPPDPDRSLRTRTQQPTGGTVTLVVGGTAHEAAWDPALEAWTAAVDGVAAGDEVTVPAGGLVDGHGNRSGAATTLTVGEVAPPEWPPHIGSGGERPPAPADLRERYEAVLELLE